MLRRKRQCFDEVATMNVPNINDIIAANGLIDDDLDPTQTEEIYVPISANCENVLNVFLWNQHFQTKILTAERVDEQQCYVFYSLNSFTHKKINFVCNDCFDIAKCVWYNTIPNAFSKRHHCHASYIIHCDKCDELCNHASQNTCNYLAFKNKIETEVVSVNNWVNVPYYTF